MTYTANCRCGHTWDASQVFKDLAPVQAEMMRELGLDPDAPQPPDMFQSLTLICPSCKARVHHNGQADPE